MKYLDNEYRIMRYLAKPKKSGKLMLAHLKCLKPIGNDYDTLVELQKKRDNKEDISELIDFTDAEFDMEKVKQLFSDYNLITKADFDTAKQSLEVSNHIRADKFEAEAKAVTDYDAFEDIQKAKIAELDRLEAEKLEIKV